MKTNKSNTESNNMSVNNTQATEQVENAQVAEVTTEQTKVSTKVAIKSISKVAAYVRAERKGANATIRILMDAASSGNVDAINTLCALCDVPVDMINAITLDIVRQAVNDYYPYVAVMDNGRKINVKAKSVHYTTASTEEETQEDAKKRVVKGFYADEVTDYLTALTSAAKARAKGQKQVIVDTTCVYEDNKMTSVAGVSVEDIKQAIERKIFSFANVNVWRKNNIFGYYI